MPLRITARTAYSAICGAPHTAEFERELIRERTTAGMKAAKRRGRHVGRPRKLGPDQLDMAAQLMAADRSQREVARALGVSASTLRDAMKQRHRRAA